MFAMEQVLTSEENMLVSDGSLSPESWYLKPPPLPTWPSSSLYLIVMVLGH